ncbi:MAG: M20/M25/M40 family metallo-hydrolase [Fluviicola sp.]
MRFLVVLFLSIFTLQSVNAQTKRDSVFIRKVYDIALSEGHSYENLRSLCKDIGARITGSAEAEMAVEWSEAKMKSYGFDKVYKQEITVPHWERGTKEAGWVRRKNGELIKVHLLALGGSISTNGLMEGELITFPSLTALQEASQQNVAGKIVFINQPMNEKEIQTFRAYGGCYPIRGNGAVEAGRLNAKAVIIRSLGLPIDPHPHTGSMHYNDSITKIPAAAISTQDAERIQKWVDAKEPLEFIMELDCRSYPDVTSYNVIAEMTGSERPDEIITFGGHLDSWDTGEGAHDDGAGVIHCLEALRILKEMEFTPKHTLRLVFFMNEENGNFGGKSYAKIVKEKGEKHIAALESDRGGFAPRGFTCDGGETYLKMLASFEPYFAKYDLHIFDPGYGGVDISPLKTEYDGIPLFGFVPDSQRYFDFHHAESDVFENVNKRELELGCAAIASFLYLLDSNL